MDRVRVHHLNFFEPEAKAIHSLAYDETCAHLAVSRSDCSIEIWDLRYKPYMEKVILGQPVNSIECLVWYNGRLFSAGLQGEIIEYDVVSLLAKDITRINVGCCVWCMSLNEAKTLLAAGTEDGYVSIYKISDFGLDFVKVLNKQEGRILSIAWHASGNILVTGSIDTIRIYNVNSGRVVDRIMMGRSEKHVETIVWCLAITRDMTIISGDSRGRTSFWNGKTGTLLSSSTSHKAGVLALCVSKDENTVYTSGVDPVIIMHSRTQSDTNQERNTVWIKSVQRNIHTHDVRALLVAGEFLVSGGVDTNLVFSKFPPKTVISFCPFSHASYCSVAAEVSCVLLKYPNHLDVWKLGNTSANSAVDGESLPLNELPVNLVKIKCSSQVITCSAISSNGQWLAYSTLNYIALFRLTLGSDPNNVNIKKIKALPFKEAESAKCLTFTSSSDLIILTMDDHLQILECTAEPPVSKATFTPNLLSLSGRIHLMALSRSGLYLALGTRGGYISVFDLSVGKVHSSLPSYKCPATAMEFDLDSENLIIVYSDRKVVEFCLSTKTYSGWCQKQTFEDFQNCSHYPIRGISFVPNNKKLFLTYEENAAYVFDKSVEYKPASKRIKHSEDATSKKNLGHSGASSNYRTVTKYKHLLDMKTLQGDQMLFMEVKPTHILDKLPPALQRKKYGT